MESPSLSLAAVPLPLSPPPKKEKVEEELEEDLFRTPTSLKSKLPSVPSPRPPPAPKKGRRMVGCKRRLTSEFEIIGVTAEELHRVFGPRDPPAVPAEDRAHAKKCKLNYQ